jgi:nitroreductase
MDFYEVIEKRRTIRDFENVDIKDDIIERIIGEPKILV